MADKAEDEQGAVFKALSNLFGVRWDDILKWIVVAYASAWFWFSAVPDLLHGRSLDGPIDWGIAVCNSLAITVPDWIVRAPDWLSAPDRSWLQAVLPVIAAICGTCAVAARRSSGLVILGTVAVFLSIQASHTLRPLGWAGLWAALPAGAAFTIAMIQRYLHYDREVDTHFLADLIVQDYLLAGLSPLWQPLCAPGIGAYFLVATYGKRIGSEHATRELTSVAIGHLHASQEKLADAPAVDVIGALAGILLTEPNAHARQDAASWVRATLNQPRGAKVVQRNDL